MVVVGALSIQVGSTPLAAKENRAGIGSPVANDPPSPEMEQLLLAEYTTPALPLNVTTRSHRRLVPAPPSSWVLSLSLS